MEPKFKVGDKVKLKGTQYKHGTIVAYGYSYEQHVYLVQTKYRLYLMDENQLEKEVSQ